MIEVSDEVQSFPGFVLYKNVVKKNLFHKKFYMMDNEQLFKAFVKVLPGVSCNDLVMRYLRLAMLQVALEHEL